MTREPTRWTDVWKVGAAILLIIIGGLIFTLHEVSQGRWDAERALQGAQESLRENERRGAEVQFRLDCQAKLANEANRAQLLATAAQINLLIKAVRGGDTTEEFKAADDAKAAADTAAGRLLLPESAACPVEHAVLSQRLGAASDLGG